MKISFINIKGFRRLNDVQIDFSAEKTLFVGANNSGKTSAMDAERLKPGSSRLFMLILFVIAYIVCVIITNR